MLKCFMSYSSIHTTKSLLQTHRCHPSAGASRPFSKYVGAKYDFYCRAISASSAKIGNLNSFRFFFPEGGLESTYLATNTHLNAQRWVQDHGVLVVHVLEEVERHDEVPVLVRLDDILQLLRKRRPEDIVRKVQALRKTVQLAYL